MWVLHALRDLAVNVGMGAVFLGVAGALLILRGLALIEETERKDRRK